MIESRGPSEGVHRVTSSAIGREAGKGVIGICRFLEVSPMATETCDRGAGEPVVRGRVVARQTVKRSVAANKRKPSALMPLNHIGDFP